MRIDNVQIYGLEESLVASGLPMTEQYNETEFEAKVFNLRRALDPESDVPEDKRFGYTKPLIRMKNLASCAGGESHDCALCGIVVQFNVTAPRYWFPEFQRYHFMDIESSTSTMHKLLAFVKRYNDYTFSAANEIREHFSPLTDANVIAAFFDFAKKHIDDVEAVKANLPDGFLQTARITTNYRQLKTQYRQRHNHRLKEWRDYCEWIETLPFANDLIICRKEVATI